MKRFVASKRVVGLLSLVLVLIAAGAGLSVTAQDGSAGFTPRAYAEQAGLIADDGAAGDNFGSAVSLSQDGNTAVLGAPNVNSGTGAAYVFTRSGTTWTQQQELTRSDPGADDLFGFSVALSGDGNYAIVGAYQDSPIAAGSGSVYVFVRNGSVWSQQQKLTASDGSANAQFGRAVAINGDGTIVLVGAEGDDNYTGAAYAFTRSSTVWSQQGTKLKANDAAADSFFGSAVSLSTNGVVGLIGAQNHKVGDNFSAGAAYVFARNAGVWSQQQLLPQDSAASAGFGGAVSLAGGSTHALVGAPGADNFKGAAYVFLRDNGVYGQQVKLTALDGAASDEFGTSVFLSPNSKVALVGAPNDDSFEGAAYAYFRNGTAWSPLQKVNGSDTVASSAFGESVASNVDGSTSLVGAIGVSTGAGKGYVFSDPSLIPTNTPTPSSTFTPSATPTLDPNVTSTPDLTTTPAATVTATATETPIPVVELVDNGGFENKDLSLIHI